MRKAEAEKKAAGVNMEVNRRAVEEVQTEMLKSV